MSPASKKVLYLSDLDGTLLTKDARLSDYAVKTLTRLLDQGVLFSFATARTGESALKIMKELPLKVPAILMNGVLIYNFEMQEFVSRQYLEKDAVQTVKQLLCAAGIGGFLYRLEGRSVMTYYETADSPEKQAFIEERQKRYQKPFTQVDHFSDIPDEDTIYFTLLENKERLDRIAAELERRPDIGFTFYRDIYHPGKWYLEIFSGRASKYHAACWLKDYLKADKLVGFGDNLNDLPLFRACDETYAVGNAVEELKQRATGVILPNTEDGVPHFLEEHAGL